MDQMVFIRLNDNKTASIIFKHIITMVTVYLLYVIFHEMILLYSIISMPIIM